MQTETFIFWVTLMNQDERSGFDDPTTRNSSGNIHQTRWNNHCLTRWADEMIAVTRGQICKQISITSRCSHLTKWVLGRFILAVLIQLKEGDIALEEGLAAWRKEFWKVIRQWSTVHVNSCIVEFTFWKSQTKNLNGNTLFGTKWFQTHHLGLQCWLCARCNFCGFDRRFGDGIILSLDWSNK